jgi:CHAD domain-containing protein
MDLHSVSFRIIGDKEDSLAALQDKFLFRRESSSPRRIVYFDTFDWRLYKKKRILCSVSSTGDENPTFEFTDFSGKIISRSIIPAIPQFAEDFPSCRIKRSIQPIVSIRRLFPIASLTFSGQLIRVLDSEEKTVVRLNLSEWLELSESNQDSLELPVILEAQSVRGYLEEFNQVRDFFIQYPNSELQGKNELDTILELIGESPAKALSREDICLRPEFSSLEAAKIILRAQLETIEATEEGTRQNLDTEFLHDFRVAVRRTRSALGQIKGVFDPEKLERFRRDFSWLGKITGPTRDLDVYLLKFEKYQSRLPFRVRSDLNPLRDFLVGQQSLEQSKLARALVSRKYHDLLKRWNNFLYSAPEETISGPRAGLPVSVIASRRIWKVYRRIVKTGERIHHKTPAEQLHQIRIECKKLRYLMEFFRSLYPADEIKSLISALKKLQDNLGDFNDYEVQQYQLRYYAHLMHKARKADPDTLLAMGRLMQQMAGGQQEEKERFKECFEKFASSENKKKFRLLFSQPKTGNPA